MHALDALAGAEAEVDRAPGGEKRGKRTHVADRCAAHAEGRCQPRQSSLVDQAFLANRLQALADRIQRLVPGNRHEAGILVAAFPGIGALHRREHPVGVVGLLDRAVGLDAAAAIGRVDALGVEIGQDFGRDAVPDLDLHQAWSCDAVIAIGRDSPAGVILVHVFALVTPRLQCKALSGQM